MDDLNLDCGNQPDYNYKPCLALINDAGYIKIAQRTTINNSIIVVGGRIAAVNGNNVTIVNKWGMSFTITFMDKDIGQINQVFEKIKTIDKVQEIPEDLQIR